jgi:purine nucleosidase
VKPAILLDCDTGIDDALALLFLARLVRSGQAELTAIGTVFGNVAVDVAAANTLRVLELAGLPGIPVAIGAARPMVGDAIFAPEFHGGDGLGDTGMPAPAGHPVAATAPDQLIRLARERPGELTLLAVGPLTNLGIALLLEPALPRLLRQVVIMGGALDHPGNVTSHAEANIWHDPEAAELVLAAPWPVMLVPLDATHSAAVDGDWLDRLAAGGSDTARLATRLLDFYSGAYLRTIGRRGAVIHDALAAVLAVDPAAAQYAERPVYVDLRGDRIRGATLWDRRAAAGADGRPPVRVAVRPDVAAFHDRLLTSLL